MKRICLFALFMLLFNLAKGQTNDQFKPGGKPFMRVFNNFHTTFSDDESASAFELTRLYLGYEYLINENFTALATLDVADPGTGKLKMTAFAKNAYLNYHNERFSAFFGIIPTTQFKVQEDFWGYRYIEKSFQDAYGFNSSADLGVSASYKISDFLSTDIIVANGEGYKNLESDSVLRAGLGITLKPAKKFLSRIYYDFSHRDATLSSLAFFTSYANEHFSLAAEYNKQMNYDFRKGADLWGTSVYGTLQATKKIRVLARYDKLMSNKVPGTSEDWNLANDGELFIAGVEFPVVKGIRFSPNLRGWNPAGPRESFRSSIYFNLEIKL